MVGAAPQKFEILVVDDNRMVLNIAKWVLKPAGYAVITTSSPFCGPRSSSASGHT